MIKRSIGVTLSTCNLGTRIAVVISGCVVIAGLVSQPASAAVLAHPTHMKAVPLEDTPSMAHFTSVPLESLPLSNSENITILSPGNPGHYRGDAINRGLQLQCLQAHGDFKLANRYDQLTGVWYADDHDFQVQSEPTIYDSSDPAHKKVLFHSIVHAQDRVPFHISVRGVTYLTIDDGEWSCNGYVDLVATLTAGVHPPTQVLPRYPTNGAGVSGNSKVLFGWQSFPHATSYAFHIWLVGLSGSASLTSTTPFSFSASIYHKMSYTWDDHGFLPGTYQYSLLPLDDQGHNLAGWSTPTQIIIAS